MYITNSKYMHDMKYYGILDSVMADLFEIASKYGEVSIVKKMFEKRLIEKERQLLHEYNLK